MRKPKDWQEFERATRILVQCVLEDPNAQLNGRQGQPQHGVDIPGTRKSNGRRVGVQCKQHLHQAVTKKELQAELKKAMLFQPPIDEFILATTAPRDAAIQTVARQLTEDMRKADRPIHVAVWGWEDIEELAAEHVDAQKAFDPTYHPYAEKLGENIGRKIDDLVASEEQKHHPADERLLTDFRALVTQPTLQWLHDHDFGNPVRSSFLDPLETIGATWRGADYEFVNAETQAAFMQVLALTRKLTSVTATHLFPMANPEMRTVKTDEDQRTGRRSQQTLEATKVMNAMATDLWKAIDAFFRIARAKIVF